MLMVDGSSSVLWVANYLMMSIGWAGQKKIGKIRQQSSFTFVFFYFSLSSKSNGSSSSKFRRPGRNPGSLARNFLSVGCWLTFAECTIPHDTLGCNFARSNIIPGLGSRGRPQHTKQPLTICCRRTGRREAAAGRASCCSGTCLFCHKHTGSRERDRDLRFSQSVWGILQSRISSSSSNSAVRT